MPQNSADALGMADRLKIVADRVGGMGRLADRAGIPIRTLTDYAAGKVMPADRLVAVADAASVSVEWLATGRGSGGPPMTAGTDDLGDGDVVSDFDLRATGFSLIPRYDVSASAGAGVLTDVEQVRDYMAFKTSWIRNSLGTDPSKLWLMTSTGDSMFPTIQSSDLLLVDGSIDRIQDDAIYVIVRDGFLIVKRLQRFFNGTVAIKSDNPAYASETIEASDLPDLRIVGRVVWIARII